MFEPSSDNTHATIARIELYRQCNCDSMATMAASALVRAPPTKLEPKWIVGNEPCSAHCFHSTGMEVENWSETVLMLFCSHLIFPDFFSLSLLWHHSLCPLHAIAVWFEEIRFNLPWHVTSKWSLLVDVNMSHIRTPFVCTQQKSASQKANSEFPIFTLCRTEHRTGNSLMLVLPPRNK